MAAGAFPICPYPDKPGRSLPGMGGLPTGRWGARLLPIDIRVMASTSSFQRRI
jgi:hypothetical protein